jgi:GST-like protein
MGGLGPMAGQNHHFVQYAPEKLPYAIDRYVNETARLYKVLDNRLADRAYLAGAHYTIADMASYPWVVPWKRQQMDLARFPNLARWFHAIAARPAVQRAYELAKTVNTAPVVDPKSAGILFGQNADTLERPR